MVEIITVTKSDFEATIERAVENGVSKALEKLGATQAAENLPEFFTEKQLRERYQITHAGIYYMERDSKVLQPYYVGKNRKRYSREHILALEKSRTLNLPKNG